MADEALRMQAEVTDRFSGPLKALRAQLLDTTRTGVNHTETLGKGFKAVEGAMQSTARTASSIVNPALAALGVTGLGVGVAVAGISAALNKLTGNMVGLGQLNRETGIAAKTLQEFGAVAGRFGVEQEAVASGAKNFAAQMRLFSRSTGEAFQWVIRQGTDAAGRKAFQDFATDLQHTSDEGEKLKKALAFMETIKNPVERGIFAQQFFGNADFGRLADGHLGKVVDLFKKAREKLGEYDPADIINAEKFDRSLGSLKSSMQRFGMTIAREVLGPATEFTTWMDDIVSGKRADVTKALRDGLREVKGELAAIDWKQAGNDSLAFLKESTALAGSLAKAFHEIAETIHAMREGKGWEVLRRLDGAQGPLAQGLAPMQGDDEKEAQNQVTAWKKALAEAEYDQETGGPAVDFKSREPYLRQKLQEAESNLSRLQNRTPEDRKKDFEATEKLRKSTDALTEEMKLSRNGATVSKMSADSDGPFGGARVQTAGFGGRGFGGGGRIFGGAGGGSYGGGSGPGYSGEQGPAGAGAGRSFGGGRFNGLGGGRPNVPSIGPRPDLPSVGNGGVTPPGGYPGISARDMRGINPEMADYIRRSAIAHGIDPNVALRIANSEGLRGSIPGVRNTPGDKGTSFGPFQLHYGSNIPGLTLKGLGDRYTKETGHHASDPKYWKEQIDFALRTARREGWGAWHGRIGARIGLRDGIGTVRPVPIEDQPTTSQRGPTAERADDGKGDTLPNGLPRVLKPESMKDAPGYTMRQSEEMRGAREAAGQRRDILADPNDERRRAEGSLYSDENDRRASRDLGIALRATRAQQRLQTEELRSGGARVGAAAAEAGVVAPQVNGSVTTVIEKAGPEARAKTTASGNLFQTVKTQNGAQMRKAD